MCDKLVNEKKEKDPLEVASYDKPWWLRACSLPGTPRDSEEDDIASSLGSACHALTVSKIRQLQGSHFSGISLILGKSEVPFQGNSHSFSEKDM